MVKFNERMSAERARGMNAVVLAFIGDAAYSLYVRESLVFASDYKTGVLQKLSAERVSAKGQAKLIESIYEKLTAEEQEIFLRGRNAKKPTKSKNASVAEYNLSTGFEAVIGYLYLTGNYGRHASGVGPVRGQNNVQGTCDMGLLPNNYPGYQSVADPQVRQKFEKAWGRPLPSKPGMMLTQVPHAVLEEKDPAKKIHAYYIIGEDPAQSDPNLAEVRETLSNIDFVIVQDIFFNKTCEYADVIFPATAWGEHDAVYTSCDRRFQRVRKLVEPQDGCLTDWDITCRLATAMGYPMHYADTEQIWDEMRRLCPKFTGATYEKIAANHGVQWPCTSEDPSDTGTPILHEGGHFATADHKGHFYYYPYTPVRERENTEYPFSLATVREVGHYSVRTMTGNCRVLAGLADEPGYIAMNTEDCRNLDITEGELVNVVSPRGHTITRCLPTDRVSPGSTYMTYQWWIGACNELTTSVLDPKSRTPEFKYCACRIEKIQNQKYHEICHIQLVAPVHALDSIQGYQQQEHTSDSRLFSLRYKVRRTACYSIRPRDDHHHCRHARQRGVGGSDRRSGETVDRLAEGVLGAAADLRG